MRAKLSPRAALVVIAAIFILPLVAAWLMYTGVIEFRPGATRNLGQLVEPPRPITWEGVRPGGAKTFTTDEFAGHWLVVHAVASPCEDACMEAIAGLRQVHRAAGRNQSRIRVALLHDGREGDRLQRLYDAFYLLESPGGELWRTLESVAGGAQPAAHASSSRSHSSMQPATDTGPVGLATAPRSAGWYGPRRSATHSALRKAGPAGGNA